MQFSFLQDEKEEYFEGIEDLIRIFSEFPYKKHPYKKRNWGHGYHFLCSYQSKLKPALAHYLVKIFTKKGEVILDPFSGSGSVPFEACLQGRIGIGIDINPVAYHNTHAKVNRPDEVEVWNLFKEIDRYLKKYKLKKKDKNQILISNINGKLQDYYEEKTLEEILKARKFFLKNLNLENSAYSFVLACLLHILHGNRPYALSRRSHGITPFSPKGVFEYKPLTQLLEKKIKRTISHKFPKEYVYGKACLDSIFSFPKGLNRVDHIITSPPFINSTRFYLNNWIRLWFCGWTDKDFKSNERTDFLEELQNKNISIYDEVFKIFDQILKPNGQCIMHLGVVKNRDMGLEITSYAEKNGFKKVSLIYEDVENCETHGITDQGSTIKHSFLFLQRK